MSPDVLSRRHSITYRMTVTVCAFIILFLSLLATIVLYYFKYEFKQTIFAQQYTMLTVVAQDIDQKLIAAQKALVAVSLEVTPQIVNDPEAAQRLLDNRPGTRGVFDNGLFLLSKDGRIISESPYFDNRRGRDISFREFFKQTVASGQPVISEPYLSTHTPGAPAVMFTSPIRDKSGKLIAILGGSLNLQRDNFLGGLSNIRIAKSGYLYLISGDRTMIMHPDRSRIMTKDVLKGSNKLLDKALSGFEGSEENVNSRGLRALTSVKRLKTTGWIIAANYPLAEAYEPIYRAQKYLIAAVIFCVILTVLVIRLMMVRFTNSLVQFASHLKHISSKSGDDRLFRIESKDEIGLMAKTFNTMIQDHDRKSEQLLHSGTHDAMSGLYNRAFFDEELKRFSFGRLGPVSVIMADIDDLKIFNDTCGHSVGDRLVESAARILLEAFRIEDVIARIGGDEFAVLLPGVNAEQAEVALKRVRNIADKFEMETEDFPVSISLGCATVDNPAELKEALKYADHQMYLDKLSRKVEKDPNKNLLDHYRHILSKEDVLSNGKNKR